jgi:hypothetical protein
MTFKETNKINLIINALELINYYTFDLKMHKYKNLLN